MKTMNRILFVTIASLLLCGSVFAQRQGQHDVIENSFALSNQIMGVESTSPVRFGPAYPWVRPVNMQNSMVMYAQILIDGVLVTDYDRWEVGAFCNGECRDDQSEFYYIEPDQRYIMMFTIAGNDDDEGEEIEFYLYDKTNQEVVEAIGYPSTDFTFTNNARIGEIWAPIALNFVTKQTFTKDIGGYGSDNNPGGYYLIASPIGEVSPEEVTNMLVNNYDFYYFDQTPELEWINYKGEDGSFNLVSGKGYLYANSNDVTLTFTGFPYHGDGQVSLVKDSNASLSGWNLVGNPFAQAAYITKPFYTMNAAGDEIISVSGNFIEPMEGVFVIAEEDGEDFTFSTEAPSKTTPALVIDVNQNRGYAIDRAILCFGGEQELPKLQLHESSTKLFIQQDNVDYAVVRSEEMGEMPVSFKPSKDGNYTLVFISQEVTFNYLHLIDNLTGKDVDLLENPSYNFDAKATDYAHRFKLVFATGNAEEDSFAFCSNGNFIINNDGEATLQVIDVTGRIMSNEVISGSCSKQISVAPGVYMLRLINGNNVKVQKVVVK